MIIKIAFKLIQNNMVQFSSDGKFSPEAEAKVNVKLFKNILIVFRTTNNKLIDLILEFSFFIFSRGIILQNEQDFKGAVDCFRKAIQFRANLACK